MGNQAKLRKTLII